MKNGTSCPAIQSEDWFVMAGYSVRRTACHISLFSQESGLYYHITQSEEWFVIEWFVISGHCLKSGLSCQDIV